MKYNFIKAIIIVILPLMVIIGCKNHLPFTPYTPAGPSVGLIDTAYNFSTLAIDPDGDSLTIRFDWGDGDTTVWTSDLDEWFAPGAAVTKSHDWSAYDTYYIRTQAMDKLGATSNWSLPFAIVIRNVISGLVWTCATDSAAWSPRESHASVVFHNKMWVIGGHDCQDQVWSSPDGVDWTCVTNTAGYGERDDHEAVVFDDKIWVIAGSDRNPMNDVWCSSDGKNWTKVADSAQWSPRWDHSAVVFDNKIWVLGGRTHGRSFSDVWYSTDGINWICATESTECVSSPTHSSVVFDNKIWVMGGEIGSTGLGSNEVWYSSNGRDWALATDSASWPRRYYHTSVVFDNKMWILGGNVDDGSGNYRANNDVWFSEDGYFWTCETSLTQFPKRFDHTSVVFHNKIWVLGGYKNQIELSNDVWYRDIIYNK